MRPPLAGKRAAARRLGAQVRRRLEPVQRVVPVRRPESEAPEQPPAALSRDEVAAVAGAQPQEPTPADPAARIDAARERLRASIEPPDEPEA